MYLVQVIFIVPLVCDVSDLTKCVQIVRKYFLYTYTYWLEWCQELYDSTVFERMAYLLAL